MHLELSPSYYLGEEKEGRVDQGRLEISELHPRAKYPVHPTPVRDGMPPF